MSDLKLLSVIIPAYNTEKYLEKCVDSVVNQTYKNIEIIIVDDGSSDSTPQICDELAAKYHNIKVIHQSNQGSSKTRENGLNASTGEYIAFIDSDDYIDLTAYEKAIKVLEENDCDMVQFGICDVDLKGNIIKEWHRDNMTFNNSRDVYLYFLTYKTPTWSMVDKVYKRSLFNNIEWPHISMMEDYCISAQLFARTQKLMTIDEYFYYYIQNPTSLCHDNPNTNPKIRNEQDTANEFVINFTDKTFPEFLPEILWRRVESIYNILINYISQGYNGWREVIKQLLPILKQDYKRMKQELKAQGRELCFNKKLIRKTKIHLSLLIHCPSLYKFYLKTRLKIHALTGI